MEVSKFRKAVTSFNQKRDRGDVTFDRSVKDKSSLKTSRFNSNVNTPKVLRRQASSTGISRKRSRANLDNIRRSKKNTQMTEEDEISGYDPMFFTQNVTQQIAKMKIKKKPEDVRHLNNNKLIAKNYKAYKYNRSAIFSKIENRRLEMQRIKRIKEAKLRKEGKYM